jgi:mono/diheme cytochrome c family protein
MSRPQRVAAASIALIAALSLHGSASFAAAGEDVPASPTFTRDVLPILQKSCQDCHRPEGLNLGGMVAPMSLRTYEETRPWAKAIGQAVASGKMPPWHASEAERGLFVDERYLTDHEIATIVAWVRSGAPQGDPADAPPPVDFPVQDGWHIGKPDLVLKLPVTHCLDDDTQDEYETIEQTLTEDVLPHDRWIKALEFRPSGRFVHHIIVHPLGGIAPGYQPRVFPEGQSMRLRTGTRITWQMHYHKEPGPGTRVCDTDTALALRFYQPGEVVTRIVHGEGMAVRGLRIPPGAASYSKDATHVFDRDAFITAFNPHMHLRGKAARFVAHFPDGREQVLLDVPKYDFNWQHSYIYREPVFVPEGTRLVMTLTWDNSAGNRANPDPGATVTWGQPTTAEMGLGFMKFMQAEPVRIVVGPDGGSLPAAESGGR